MITNKYKRNLIKRIANTNHVHDFFKFPLSRKTNKYLEHEYPSRIQLQTLTRSIHEISLEKLEGREHPPAAHPPYLHSSVHTLLFTRTFSRTGKRICRCSNRAVHLDKRRGGWKKKRKEKERGEKGDRICREKRRESKKRNGVRDSGGTAALNWRALGGSAPSLTGMSVKLHT